MKRIHNITIIVFIFLIFYSFILIFSSFVKAEGWEIIDIVTPSSDSVDWIEKGTSNKPATWISDGRWHHAYSRQILVKSENYIFATFQETFNWTAVNASFEKEGWHPYDRFDDFRNNIINDPGWWLIFSWNMPTEWLGISINKTRIEVDFDESTFTAHVEITTYITNIPGYFMDTAGRLIEMGIGDEKLPKPLFAGYDLASIYIGDLEAFQLQQDYKSDGRKYEIQFRAPSNLISQNQDTYTLGLDVAPQYWGQSVDNHHIINISMPSDTEVNEALPSKISTYNFNSVTYSLTKNDTYPQSFKVTSGPPIQDFSEIFFENIGRWITEPEIWVALATAVALIYAAFHGKGILNKRKTYHRLYRTMVSIFDRYSLNYSQFYKEIENLSKSITKYFIEDQITDEQFDKLFARKDDLLERVQRLDKNS
jgi:hypothetical protein